MNELALFAGAGGGILGDILCGFRTVCAVEHDPYARDVLVARQNDGCLAPFPIWDDVCTFDGRPWRGVVDALSGGFPCQDISAANTNAVGIAGERSGLWREMARIAGEVEPPIVIVENSPMLVGRGLGLVLGDLASLGYDCRWGIVGAHHAGAPHKRDRIWIVAYSPRNEQRRQEQRAERKRTGESGEPIIDPHTVRCGRKEGGELRPGQPDSLGLQQNVSYADRRRSHSEQERISGSAGASDVGGDGTDGFLANAPSVRQSPASDREIHREAEGNGKTDLPRSGGEMSDARSAGCEGNQQPRTLRNHGQGAETHGPTCECGSLPGSQVSDSHGVDANGGGPGTSSDLGERAPAELFRGEREWWIAEPDVGRVAHGVAARVDRLRCLGNGQVPAVVQLAWSLLRKPY